MISALTLKIKKASHLAIHVRNSSTSAAIGAPVLF